MKSLLQFHAATSLLLAVLIYFLNSRDAAVGFAFGATVSFFNLVLLVIVWPRILAKKLVALSVGIIVIKFAILAWILYEVVTKKLVQVGWFATGLGVVIITVLAASVLVPQATLQETDLN